MFARGVLAVAPGGACMRGVTGTLTAGWRCNVHSAAGARQPVANASWILA